MIFKSIHALESDIRQMEGVLNEMRALLPKLKALQSGSDSPDEEERRKSNLNAALASVEASRPKSQREVVAMILGKPGSGGMTRDEIFAQGNGRFPSLEAVSQILSRYDEFEQLGDGKWWIAP